MSGVTNEEIKEIREFLYQLANIQLERENKLINLNLKI